MIKKTQTSESGSSAPVTDDSQTFNGASDSDRRLVVD
jgi:hypothetical protein